MVLKRSKGGGQADHGDVKWIRGGVKGIKGGGKGIMER